MEKLDRLQLFNTSLNKIVKEANEYGIAIFEASPDKFVQFSYDSKDDELICDIPLAELSSQEEHKLLLLKEFSKDYPKHMIC